ncbi:MAG: Gfo/Idh/MocA family oxidoreductase [Rhizobiales bacterium]|nr:Gfo/Idh/MocA family oxidoreductase [Hyphomicrobiales bacterium]
MAKGKVKVGIIGSRFEADIHAESFKILPDEAEVVAIASPTPGNAAAMAKRHGIPRVFTDYREMLKEPDIEMITITAPNRLHAQMTIDIANAGKHVVCEKPLCVTLEEADEMIDVCNRKGVLLNYAEELFFTPKYVKAKEMADQGAFGRVHYVKQAEKHFGPHSDWFWDPQEAGGGAFADLGCHGIAFVWWFLGRPGIKSVYAQMNTQVHGDRTEGDDETHCIIEFDNGAIGIVENSWATRGGMHDTIEVRGSHGLTSADLHRGNALPTYSENGFAYAVEKAPSTKGWTYPVFDELYNYGFPQEMQHFARAVRGKEAPICTGEVGRVVQEVLYAGYASAALGQKIHLPFRPKGITSPISLWKNADLARRALGK